MGRLRLTSKWWLHRRRAVAPDEEALCETGAKAAALTREAMVRMALNMMILGLAQV